MIFIFQLNTGKRHNGCAINYGKCEHYVPGKKLPTRKGKRTFGKAKQPKPKLKQRNDAMFHGNLKMSPDKMKQLEQWEEEGKSQAFMAEQLGITQGSVSQWLKKAFEEKQS